MQRSSHTSDARTRRHRGRAWPSLWLCAACTVALAAVATEASAQPAPSPGEDARARARDLGEKALAAYSRGEWSAAYADFAAANEILEAPTLRLFMARCKRRLGELLRARDLLQALAEEPLPPDAPDQFAAAKADAQRELAELIARIPGVVVRVTGAPPEAVSVELDGTKLPAADLGKPVLVDPGAHEIAATADGFAPAKRTVEVSEGANQDVSLELVRAGEAPRPDDGGGGSLAPAAVAFALGGAGLAMGAVTGGLAIPKVDDLKSRCVDDHCPIADQSLADEVRTLTTLSTVGFVVGGVGVATGIILAIVQPGGDDAGDDEASAPGPTIALRVSPLGGFWLEGVLP